MARGSAAYVLAIVVVVAGIVGSLVLTVMDPVMQAVFDSAMWSSTTTYGTDALQWQQDAWTFLAAFMLLALTVTVWIETRRTA